jgi:4-amino-4-deoxy-L-arabinose transferase-like glycosyltransferase
VTIIRSRAGLALIGAALALRAVLVRLTPGYVPHHDDRAYLLHALALVHTHAYPVYHVAGHAVPTAYRAPGWPFVLAIVHAVLGGGLVAPRLVQAALGAAVVAAVGAVSAEVWGRRTALIAMAIAAVSPALVVFGASLLSEPLFAALALASIACALHAHGRVGWAVAAGVLAGAAALTRPEGLFLVLAIALCAGGRRAALVVAVVAALCVAPWTVRNAVVMHAFVPVSTEAGNTLAGTYNEKSLHDARWRDPRLSGLYPAQRKAHRGDEVGNDTALLHAVGRWVLDHPLYPARVAYENGRRLAGAVPTSYSVTSLHVVSLPPWPAPWIRVGLLLVTALALAGACLPAARQAPPGWWLGLALVFLAALMVNGEQRFAFPLEAWLAPLAALPLSRGR